YDTAFRMGEVGDKAAIVHTILSASTAAGATTPLYDNILKAYQYMRANLDRDEINAVVVLTDGTENNRGVDAPTVLAAINGHDVRVYCIAFGPDQESIPDLRRIAQKTGGALFDATSGGDTTLTKAFALALSVV